MRQKYLIVNDLYFINIEENRNREAVFRPHRFLLYHGRWLYRGGAVDNSDYPKGVSELSASSARRAT